MVLPLQNENWGEIRTDTPPEYEAGALSRQLISADLAQMRAEKWVNKTMVDIPARTSAGMVWLPVGAKGSLVAFGGTVMDLSTSTTVDKATLLKYNAKMASMKTQGSNFMKVVHVYDIENSAWFDQQTSGDIPPPTADFCSVVASSQDGTSHQV